MGDHSQHPNSMNGENIVDSMRWCLSKIDESTQASCLGHPTIDRHLIDRAINDSECSSVSTILVLYTGGTIGMRCVQGAYQPVPNFLIRAVMKMPAFNDPTFVRSKTRGLERPRLNSTETDEPVDIMESVPINTECSSPNTTFVLPLTKDKRRIFYSIAEYTPLLDSSDMTMDDWVRIAGDIHLYYKYFDGFVVLHGTDTLAYTASGLSFMLQQLDKPVVMTGSQLPIFDFRSDGWNNFVGALLIAGGAYPIREVTVFFHDTLFRGNRVVKCSSNDFHAFGSPNYPVLAKCGTDIEFFPDLMFCPTGSLSSFTVHSELCRDVTVINIFPSISADHVATCLAPPTKGAVIRTYGAGNVPSSRRDLLSVLKAASDRGVLMVNVTQCYQGGVKAIYSTGMILNEYGVIPGYDITTEAALAKLAYVLGNKDFPDLPAKRVALLQSLRGEVTIQGKDAQTADLFRFKDDRVRTERSLVHYFADLFARSVNDDNEDGRALMWARRLTPALACMAAGTNNVPSLVELHRLVGHLQFASSDGSTTLHKATRHGHLKATKYLLEQGVSVHTKDLWGMTPLDYAIQSPDASAEMVQLLLQGGASLTLTDLHVPRAVNQAAAMGDIKRLQIYKFAGCTLEELDSEGRNALHVAVANHQLETVHYLTSSKLQSTRIPNTDGENPSPNELSSSGLTNCYLGGAGISSNSLTSWGTTALDEAKLKRFDDVVKILQFVISDV